MGGKHSPNRKVHCGLRYFLLTFVVTRYLSRVCLFLKPVFPFCIGLNSLKFVHGVSSPNTDNVVNSVVHALTSRDPQSHYLVSVDAKALALLAMMPTRLTDVLLNIARFNPGPRESDRWTPVCCDTA